MNCVTIELLTTKQPIRCTRTTTYNFDFSCKNISSYLLFCIYTALQRHTVSLSLCFLCRIYIRQMTTVTTNYSTKLLYGLEICMKKQVFMRFYQESVKLVWHYLHTVVYCLRLFYYFDGRWKLERLALLRVWCTLMITKIINI